MDSLQFQKAEFADQRPLCIGCKTRIDGAYYQYGGRTICDSCSAHIRAAHWGEPITLVALTGWGQESDRQAALAAGFDYHFVKPVDLDTVLGTLLASKPGSESAGDAGLLPRRITDETEASSYLAPVE